MNSRNGLNLALLVLVVAIALIALYLPGIKKPVPLPLLTQLLPEQITHIHIARGGQQDIDLVKNTQGWTMIAPLPMPANAFRIDGLLRLTQTRSQSQFPVTAQDLRKFNLDAPPIRVRLNDTEIAFGAMEPLNHQRYVLIGNTVHLIFDIQHVNLIAPPTVWISNSLLPPAAQLTELTLPSVTLTRQDNGHWSVSPASTELSGDNINVLLDEWTHAQAVQVNPYANAPAQGEVTVRLRSDPNPIRFVITGRQPELILARTDLGVQYHLPAALADRLLKLPVTSSNK